VAVEDPHVTVHDPRRGVDDHLAGEMADDADVVVPEDQLHGQPLAEELGEEVENDRSERGRGPDDRVFRVARDDDPLRPGRAGELDQPFCEEVGRALGRTERTLGRAPET